MTPLKTVTFQAKATNSAPPPQPEPKPRSNDGPLIIAVFNAMGVAWILSSYPLIAAVIAFCVAGVSVSMRKHFLARGLSLVVSAAIVSALIAHPPVLSKRPSYYRQIEQYKPSVADMVVLYAIAVVALGMLHKVVGEPDPIPVKTEEQPKPKEPEDPNEVSRKKGFQAWLGSDRLNISFSTDTATAVDKVYAEYLASLKKHPVEPPAYDMVAFRDVFKSSTGKEPVEVKGVLSYQGVSLA